MLLEVLTVAYRAKAEDLAQTVEMLAQARSAGVPLGWSVWHNDGAEASPDLTTVYQAARQNGIPLKINGGRGNLGFGGGVNAALESCTADYVLLLNQDAIPEPGVLEELWAVARADDERVAAWEMRQLPYEHPKAYDPVTLDTPWVSGAAVLLRTQALRSVKGFEPRIFMYGEDVDLSWRLRCQGWRLRYVPRCTVVHHTYAHPDEVKPLQALEGIYVNLCLRARYSGRRRVLQGLSMAAAEWVLPASFPGRRLGIAKAVAKFLRNYRYFRATHHSAPGFEPEFVGWGFETRREGAFFPLRTQAQWAQADKPLVSVLVRTHHRPDFLRQALTSIANQTWRNIEAVVVEDGSSDGEAVCREFDGRLAIRYVRLSPAQGRSVAGNKAMQEARGDWLCFLDDDDLLFADHVEVLLQSVQEHGVLGAYALAWRVFCRSLSEGVGQIQEIWHDTFPDEPFSRVAMWHHNYMPIQSVLFHRSLFEKYGGFAEDMDQLEDWNLWTRYTIVHDFVQVRKVTSKYRVPADADASVRRQARLDAAYKDAVERQRSMEFLANPEMIRELARSYAEKDALVHVSRGRLRQVIARSPFWSQVVALRGVVRRRFGR
ncbi:glycosyltransferase family 2 protein [Tepidimonas fonticaldi]|uniref:glycosyltransferase family 2 protein n=1 Tax=Tepidimonas fonticaldi TaxID=1101373 RepID=UPI0009EF076B|nr:glycosyltransferase [Tepidimonas fonticaldi]